MLPIVSYDMVRQRNEERRERSLLRFRRLFGDRGESAPGLVPAVGSFEQDADVIEVVFGTHCGREEPLGA